MGFITLFLQKSEKNPLIQLIKRQEREITTWTIFCQKWSVTYVYNATLATRPIRRFPIKKAIIYKPIITIGYSRFTNPTPFGPLRRKSRPSLSEKIRKVKLKVDLHQYVIISQTSWTQRPILNKTEKRQQNINVFIKKIYGYTIP